MLSTHMLVYRRLRISIILYHRSGLDFSRDLDSMAYFSSDLSAKMLDEKENTRNTFQYVLQENVYFDDYGTDLPYVYTST